ncbi:helix-turn-helix domain-containing protein [Bdellovibrio sp. HCB274]|uniref:helix-turn-helix domain-containing protein n=1 Tax=Bdellovibrio sp. HCB274 TaxID=3394361 RepID=UPI0039B3C28C
MKSKSVSLDDILIKELKNDEFKFAYEQRRFYLQIAHLVSDLRARTGFSQAELAKKSKVSQPMIARLEKGDSSRTPTFETIFKVLKALGYTMSINVQKDKKPRVA